MDRRGMPFGTGDACRMLIRLNYREHDNIRDNPDSATRLV